MDDKTKELDDIITYRLGWHMSQMENEIADFENNPKSLVTPERYLINRQIAANMSAVIGFFKGGVSTQAVPTQPAVAPVENEFQTSLPEDYDDGIDYSSDVFGEEETFGKEEGLSQSEVDALLDKDSTDEIDYDNYTVTTDSGHNLSGDAAHRYSLFIELPLSKSRKNEILKKGTRNPKSDILDRICVYTGKILTLQDIIVGDKCDINMIIPDKSGGRWVQSNLILHNTLTIKRITGYDGKTLKEIHPENLKEIRNRVAKSLMPIQKKRLFFSQID